MLMQTGKTQVEGPAINSRRSMEVTTVSLPFEERFMKKFFKHRLEILDNIHYLGGSIDRDYAPEIRFANGVMMVYVYCSLSENESESEVLARIDTVVRLWHARLLSKFQRKADEKLAAKSERRW